MKALNGVMFPIDGKNTKSAIIELVSKGCPLTLRQIFHSLNWYYSLGLTYQAVHKSLQELVKLEVITRDKEGYKLNYEWIKKVKKLGSSLEIAYLKQAIAENRSISTVSLSCLWDLYMYILNYLSSYTLECRDKSICVQSEHVWISPVGTEKEWNLLKESLKNIKMYVLIKSNTALDKIMKPAWESLGMRYKLGTTTETGKLMMDVFVIGDTIIQIYYPKEFVERTKKLYTQVKDINQLNMRELQDYFYYHYPENIQVLIQKNKEVAKRLRDQTERKFTITKDESTKK